MQVTVKLENGLSLEQVTGALLMARNVLNARTRPFEKDADIMLAGQDKKKLGMIYLRGE
jgi:hypothetical protein